MSSSQSQLDAVIQQFIERIQSLSDALDAVSIRITALASSTGSSDASERAEGVGGASPLPTDPVAEEILAGLTQIVSDGVRIANLDQLQTPARFG